MPEKTLSIISLGCFRNTYDSEIVANLYEAKGYTLKKDYTDCDLLIVNTCGFIAKAKEESLDVISQAVELKKKAKIKRLIVFGCLVQRYQKELKVFFPQVDEWWGTEKFSPSFVKRIKLLPAHIDFLKICEGCVNKCSYCAIPFIKGPLRSKPKEAVLKEVRYLEKKGVKELNIIGQDITSWGKDLGKEHNLVFLLKAILKTTKTIPWIRLIYTHPRHITDELIDLIAHEERICKYIDMPIQHINDRILKLMKRKTTKKDIIKLIEKIRKKIPGAIIRTSVIVGFPTETVSEFKELVLFLREVRFERLGAFVYSREEDTAAHDFKGQVHHQTKLRRYNQLMSLQKDIAQEANQRFIGKELDVLVEEKTKDLYIGRSQFDAYEVDGVVFLEKKNLKIGEFKRVKIVDAYEYDLVAK
ncbi:MAG: MiaB/RimO family radical SAM methylthiotransferase [Candidatus Omnitrophota bacterium]|nr:MAG: MiaB/RimO family radical SAM methylthiotransferase [Candidatus Omnitrophota bacterium]